MERPRADIQTNQRNITGEIVYLDELRRLNMEPKQFLELGDMAIQMYETKAAMVLDNVRLAILDEFEQYDSKPSEVVASCTALANELLSLCKPDSKLTFVDIAVVVSPEIVLEKLKAISAGSILSGNDEQLAIPSNVEYYLVLDIKKQNAALIGAGLSIWGWEDHKYVFTNKEGEEYKYPQDFLMYPADEKSSTRQIELSFSFRGINSEKFTESISLYLKPDGSASIGSNIWAMAYAVTGYEGHKGSTLHNITDDDIAAFGDLIAEIVGDQPESIAMKVDQQLQELTEAAATPSAQKAIRKLIKVTWPAQAHYFLTRRQKGSDTSLAEQFQNATTADTATADVNKIIKEWKTKLRG